jgi:hypothetical protein
MKAELMNTEMQFLADHPGISVLFFLGTVFLGFVDDLSSIIKLLTGIGALLLVGLTIVAKYQEVQINKEKLKNERAANKKSSQVS